MRILFTGYISTRSYSDPDEWLNRIRFYTGIPEALAKKHQVHCIEQISYSGLKKRNGVTYHFLEFPRPQSWFPQSLHRYVRRIEPDVVFVHGFIFPLQIIQLRFSLGPRIRILVINHAEKPGTGRRGFLQRQADRFVQHYLFTSRATGMEWVQQGIIRSGSKIREVMEVSSGFILSDKCLARKKLHIPDGRLFLFVGRLDTNKDPLTVLRAFSRYAAAQPGARLYMIYQTAELEQSVRVLISHEVSLQESVVLVGPVPHGDMEAWYNSADFIISASYYEGSGVAVCEAMSCGCIPILSDIPSFQVMTGEGSCGFLYPPGDADALLEILLQTKTMDVELEKGKTLKQFRSNLSFEAIATKIEAIITEYNNS